MKKKIAFLLLVLLATTVLLVACSQTEVTETLIRWDNTEEYTFRVALADFTDSVNKSTQTIDGKSVDFTKELSLSGENLDNRDEIRPEAVDGTYNMKIVKSSTDRYTLTTTQTLFAQYKTADLTLSNDELSALKASSADIATTSLTEKADCTILLSVIKQSVVFDTTSSQKPASSTVDSNGFYIGKAQQQQSKYKVETNYDFSGKRPIAKVSVDGATPTEYKLARNSKFIDPNQLLLYLRSYNKSSSDFQDSPSVMMFNPLTGELQTAAFAFSYNTPLIVTDKNKTTPVQYVSLNAVSVVVGGYSYMVEENVPDTVAADKMTGSDKFKYTTVRFRVGYFTYELTEYPQAIWDGLKYQA